MISPKRPKDPKSPSEFGRNLRDVMIGRRNPRAPKFVRKLVVTRDRGNSEFASNMLEVILGVISLFLLLAVLAAIVLFIRWVWRS